MIEENTKLYRVGQLFMSFNFVRVWKANQIKLNFKADCFLKYSFKHCSPCLLY